MFTNSELQNALDHFKQLLEQQDQRISDIQAQSEWVNYQSKEQIIIGVCYGDGIGEFILKNALSIINEVLKEPLASGKVKLKIIEGLTIENRVKERQAIPDAVLAEIKSCDVLLKGPTTTPQKGGKWPNIESANVKMRRELDLFANIRPVKVPEKKIDWMFFRENTEGEYALGSQGLNFDEFALDFKVISKTGTERICRAGFDYAKKMGKKRVTIVTKSNILKATDGLFSQVAFEVAKNYPGITCDEYYIDIMTANLIDERQGPSFEVFILPNLYGDILTDEAAQIQGGVGTAGSANIGKRYAMFEAIHGSAPRLIEEGLGAYANPASIIKASVLLLQHIGYLAEAKKIEQALDICTEYEKKYQVKRHGATGDQFTEYLLSWIVRDDLEMQWKGYQ
jgi:isocitrate dehydrogenase (NAD+)